jgi:subtilisin family serine protease
MTKLTKHMSKLRIRTAVVFALLAISVLGVRGANEPRRAHLSADLLEHAARHTKARARVIVRGSEADLDALAARHHLEIVRHLPGAAVLLANSTELEALQVESTVNSLSGDHVVRTWMSVSNQSTAADQTRAGKSGLLGVGAIPAVNGQGIAVAIVDSGISPHSALSNKVVANVSFVPGDPVVTDGFGHGTHVAGIVAGNGGPAAAVTSSYNGGIAPGVKLVNVRVLGNDGSGHVSDVIAGLEWVIAHKQQYNIRVVNLSLGHPVMESCSTDPLCQEVGKAARAGIVVVVAAGNYGKSPAGNIILGGIASPGNSPDAITVGALNTWSTVARSDDTVATFSSRGPTAYDLAVKPDVAAPGVKVISLQANNSLLPTLYPTIHTAGTGNNAYMYLSGTSQAVPIVAGGVALLLQGSPSLSPSQVKLALQTGASYMADGGLMGAGAGSVNFWASRQNAASGLVGSLVNTLVGGLLTKPSGASFWDAGTLSNRLYDGRGIRLLSALEAPLVWLNPSLLHYGDLNLIGLTNPLASIEQKRLQYGRIAAYCDYDRILWGTPMQDSTGQTILWGTSGDDQTILWGTTATSPDAR